MNRVEGKNTKNSTGNLKYVEPEIWKDIEGTDGWYQASNKGRIRSWVNNKKEYGRRDEPKILSLFPVRGENDYLATALGNGNRIIIHIKIAETFIPNPEGKPCVNHLDGDKQNNNVNNLEWCTYSENSIHAHETGLITPAQGSKCGSSKLLESDVLDIREEYSKGWTTQKELAKKYNVTVGAIGRIIRKKNWRHVEGPDIKKFNGSFKVRAHKAKLTDQEALEIRSRYKNEDITQKELGALYGVDQGAISKIINNKTYKYCEETNNL